MQNNQFPTKNLVELEDTINLTITWVPHCDNQIAACVCLDFSKLDLYNLTDRSFTCYYFQ